MVAVDSTIPSTWTNCGEGKRTSFIPSKYVVEKLNIGLSNSRICKRIAEKCFLGKDKIDKGSSEKYNNLPKNIRLTACSAVNLRPSAGIQNVTLPSHVTLYFSNVPGPREEVSYYGHPVAFIAPGCYGHPSGLVIHVATYVNKMSFVLSIDESIVPDPHQLCDDRIEN
ncbi:hypothetical protein Dsin_024155 [Dipteronia sinensis]|uniref:O-acyltransferase WSD1 C-terminal domain-containing protein n=1 Tax=Dipteronia sinensis TaxID=43782 RepID=A0AAE0E1C0_9ROSI|nr:hypothetical protein Dsin_024155 [Dipteronia sinensis]